MIETKARIKCITDLISIPFYSKLVIISNDGSKVLKLWFNAGEISHVELSYRKFKELLNIKAIDFGII